MYREAIMLQKLTMASAINSNSSASSFPCFGMNKLKERRNLVVNDIGKECRPRLASVVTGQLIYYTVFSVYNNICQMCSNKTKTMSMSPDKWRINIWWVYIENASLM